MTKSRRLRMSIKDEYNKVEAGADKLAAKAQENDYTALIFFGVAVAILVLLFL